MIQCGEGLGLALEARKSLSVRRKRFRQHLNRDLPSEIGVCRAVNFPHAAHADLGGDFVGAETGAGTQ